MTAFVELFGLFFVGLLASTLLPLASEPVLVGYFLLEPQASRLEPVLAISLGNTLGGLVTYLMGRGLRVLWQRWRPPSIRAGKIETKAQESLERFGPIVLVMSWLPVVGDLLCLIAGNLRLPVLASTFWIALGKLGRYALLAWLTPVL